MSVCRERAAQCADFLRKHAPLLQYHSCDFLKPQPPIAAEWVSALRSLSWEEIAGLAKGQAQDSWPASLRDFVATAHEQLIWPRYPPDSIPSQPLHKELCRGLSLKKQHEVERLAALVSTVASVAGTDHVVDLGCGEGYLTQVLSFMYALRVTGVDCQEDRKVGAERRSAKILSYIGSRERIAKARAAADPGPPGNPNQNPRRIDPDAILTATQHPHCGPDAAPSAKPPPATHQTPGDAGDAAPPPATSDASSLSQGTPPARIMAMTVSGTDSGTEQWLVCDTALIVGLHTCGDLGPSSLRLFRQSTAKALVSVGCCYHWLTEDREEDDYAMKKSLNPAVLAAPATAPSGGRHPAAASAASAGAGPTPVGYPLSVHLQGVALPLGNRVRELASHHTEIWATRTAQHHRLHGYRAALEVLLERHLPSVGDPRHGAIGRARLKAHETGGSFQCYAKAMLKRLQIGEEEISEAQIDEVSERYGDDDWKYAAALFALKQTLGAVVETLVQLDRAMFLLEEPRVAAVAIVPLFSPTDSPRNYVLVAVKEPAPLPSWLQPFTVTL